jgi:hypothetical protein
VQIGPEINGPTGGYVNSVAALFYVATQASNEPTYAWYSTDAAYPDIPIPNNEIKEVAGNNLVAWRYSVPNGVQIKFLKSSS